MAKVLLVEDDNNLREIYEARLKAEGYDIVAAQNGEEALVSAKQNKPDLIISDVMMPRISGFEMLDILRNTDELKHTKVIMLTALGQAEDQARADNLGADKYLVKSQVTLEDIVNAAKELLGEDAGTPAADPEASAPASDTTANATPPVVTTEPVVSVAAEPAASTPATAPVEPEPAASTALPAAPAESVAVPASVVPQPDTTVVVPPAPANPTPPTVTTVTVPDPSPVAEPPASAEAPVTSPAGPADETPPAATAPATDVVEPEQTEATPESAPSAEASVTASAPQTLEAEEAALQAQIDNFASKSAEAPAAASAPEESSASNDQAIAEAVEQLNTTPPEPPLVPPSAAITVAEPAPTNEEASTIAPTPAPEDTNDNVSVAGKKVIQPISKDLSVGPNLDELLAKEEAKEGVQPQAPVVDGAPASAPAEAPAHQPGQSFDPNSISL